MDIKKEIKEESEMMDELVNDIKQMSENENTENEEDPTYNDSEECEIRTVKTELDTDIGISDTDIDYSFERYDVSLALKAEEETNLEENTELELENGSLRDVGLGAKGNDFIKLEAEMYQQSDDSLDIVGDEDSFFSLDCTDDNEFSRKNGPVTPRSRNRVDQNRSDNDDESKYCYRERSDTELDYGNETDSYNEDDGENKVNIIIKKENTEDIEQEGIEGQEEGKYESINYGRKTKKAKNCLCDLCNKAFTSDNRLKRHKEQIHPEGWNEDRSAREGKYICEVCNKRFISQSRLRLHTVTHTGEKPFSCDICGQKFSHPTNKRRHMKTHTGDKPFVCLFCGKSFPVKHYLKDHLVKHTGEKPHVCKLCPMTFAHRFSLKQHELLKHPGGELNVKDSYEDRPFSCEICGKKFTQQSSLKIHVRLHTGSKPYKCTECDASFIRSDSLLRHKFEHSGQRPFQCNLCEKSFTSSYILKQHLNVHTGDRRQQCEHCGVKLANKESLARHMMRHNGESYFECKTCHKKFVHEQSLKKHHEQRCQERTYECVECGYKNNSESKLKRHMLKHNAQKLLECKICKNKFTYPSNLQRHMKVHEKDHEMKTRRKETIIPNDDVERFIAVSMKEIENKKLEETRHTNRKTNKTQKKPKANPDKSLRMLFKLNKQEMNIEQPEMKGKLNNRNGSLQFLIVPDIAARTERSKQTKDKLQENLNELQQNLNQDMKRNACYTSKYDGYVTSLKEQDITKSKPSLDDADHTIHNTNNERNKDYTETHSNGTEYPVIVSRAECSSQIRDKIGQWTAQSQSPCEGNVDLLSEQKEEKAYINKTLHCDLEQCEDIPVSENLQYRSFRSIGSNNLALLEYQQKMNEEFAKGSHVGKDSNVGVCHSSRIQTAEDGQENDTANKYGHSTGHFPKTPFDLKLPHSTVLQSTYSAVPYNAALFAGRLPAFTGSFYAQHHTSDYRSINKADETRFGGST